MAVSEFCCGVDGVSKLVGEIIGPIVPSHVARGVSCCSIDVGPVDSPSGMPEHLVEEDSLAAAVPVAKRVDQRELGPVHGDGVGGGVGVGGAGRPGGDLTENPVEFIGQELRPGVGDAESGSVACAELAGPGVDVLKDVTVNRLEVGEVKLALDGMQLELYNALKSCGALGCCEGDRVPDAEPITKNPRGVRVRISGAHQPKSAGVYCGSDRLSHGVVDRQFAGELAAGYRSVGLGGLHSCHPVADQGTSESLIRGGSDAGRHGVLPGSSSGLFYLLNSR
ncbi:hypothetical protein [Dietzia sp. UCD-THP]|uniref:hypothetical protein n=1 Tax=Dietzia sp. UCD-THP TaxID=1292020 RepID=UPI00352755DF